MNVIKYIRLPFQFDVARLQQETKTITQQHWQLHYQTKHYTGGWTVLPLRSINGNLDNIFVSPLETDVYKNTALLEQSTYLKEVLSTFKCDLLAVRLMKLEPGAQIKEHRDADLAFEKGEIRLHIPITTHPLVDFFLDQERMPLNEGECWYMNFNLPHALHNQSNVDRIHLVIDAVVNEWVNNLFSTAGLLRKETSDIDFDIATKREIIARLREMNTDTGNKLAEEMEATLTTA
jgi:quercetin dioxygenase-like cupin family protein